MFTHFDMIHERDGHTHRQTLHDDIGRTCIASLGKNEEGNRLIYVHLKNGY